MTDLRTAAQQALEALEDYKYAEARDALRAALAKQRLTDMEQKMERSIESLKAALAEPEGGGNLPPPLQEPTVAEIATTQQQLDNKPPSDYRRGYWDGFAIGKREGRIEAENALAEPVQKPVAWRYQDARGNYRYRGYVQGFDKEYSLLKPVPLYTSPPHRKPLTEEEILSLFRTSGSPTAFARAVERAHGIV